MPRGKREIVEFVLTVGERETAYALLPSTAMKIREWVKRAQERGTIGKSDSTLCTAALIAGGVHVAAQQGTGRVTVAHVRAGWRDHITILDSCTPFWLCAQRSVASRPEIVSAKLPELHGVLKLMDEDIIKL